MDCTTHLAVGINGEIRSMGTQPMEYLPQVGAGDGNPTADSDRVKAPVVGAGPMESGEDQSHAQNVSKNPVGGARRAGNEASGGGPFRRSSLIRRTPPSAGAAGAKEAPADDDGNPTGGSQRGMADPAAFAGRGVPGGDHKTPKDDKENEDEQTLPRNRRDTGAGVSDRIMWNERARDPKLILKQQEVGIFLEGQVDIDRQLQKISDALKCLEEQVQKHRNMNNVIKENVPKIRRAVNELFSWRRREERGKKKEDHSPVMVNTKEVDATVTDLQGSPLPNKKRQRRSTGSSGKKRSRIDKRAREEEQHPKSQLRGMDLSVDLENGISGSGTQEPNDKWVTQKNRRDRQAEKAAKSSPEKRGQLNKRVNMVPRQPSGNRRKGNLTDVVKCKMKDGITFAQVAAKLKTADPTAVGVVVSKFRLAKNGDALIFLKAGDKSKVFNKVVAKALEDVAEVKLLASRVTIEVRDLEVWTTAEEVMMKVNEVLGDKSRSDLTCRLRNGPSGTKTASLEMTREAADAILRQRTLCVGWVAGRVREHTQVTKCFKCQGYGHKAHNCNGPDRQKCCWRCGKEGHKATLCNNDPECYACAKKGQDNHKHVQGSRECITLRTMLQKIRGKCR